MPKRLTESELEAKKDMAVAFLRRIGDDDRADDFDDMSLDDYADHKGVELVNNPTERRLTMAKHFKTKADLEAELDEANSTIEDLQDRLSTIASVLDDEDEEEDEDDEDDSDEDEQ